MQRLKKYEAPTRIGCLDFKERRRFSGGRFREGRIIRIETRGSTLFGFPAAKTACLVTPDGIATQTVRQHYPHELALADLNHERR